MDVVCRTVDDQRRPFALPDDATHVREKPGGQLRRQNRGTVLGREDDMHKQISETMRHVLPPLRGWIRARRVPNGLRRGLWSCALRAYEAVAGISSEGVGGQTHNF